MNTLFNIPEVKPPKPTKFCQTCKHREQWQFGRTKIKFCQYCGIRKSNRTFNKLLRIKITNPACAAYEE